MIGERARGSVRVAWSRVDPPDPGRETAHALLLAQARRLSERPDDVVSVRLLCAWCGSADHGPPLLVDGRGATVGLHASTSRLHDLVLVAVSDAGPVGVDVERAGAADFGEFARVAAHVEERPVPPSDGRGRSRTWVRKESVLKATGRGLRVDPRLVRVSGPDEPPVLHAWDADDPPTTPAWIEDVPLTDAYVAAVAVLAAARPTVSVTEEARGAPRSRASR